ncbi:DNA-directed RNA polymerase subunit alpha [Catenisphaera adipataccumulans]|uniref:DNA-directed RNA polymerase subunit alpha n=1 Tax=Catenisphaera adipataccumulans TaxID=700500 RepID=A0A7W8CYN8_9FIRM|nr:DNA-directed RNA polymerase subunit alpha [Catenisphaera adipataccumulans]MBB5183811.1 DNA-directed RNA polymerase subunit alpha [Catenisphaera adipataccumulans]
MQEFERAVFRQESLDESTNTGTYVFEPLERGFGTTIGNTICQSMLMTLPGTSVIGFLMDGFDPHQLTIDGVLEDVVTLGLNLKEIRFAQNDETPVTTVHIAKKGPAVVTAADIICPETLSPLDPDRVICNLEKGVDFHLNIIVARSTGYESAEDNKINFNLGDDVYPLDATFTPIEKADYLSEPARIGFDKKYDKVHITATTDGSVTPLEAICAAAQECMDYLNVISTVSDLKMEESFMEPQEEAEESKKINTMMIEDLDLSVRSYNCLKRAGIQTVDELTQKTEDEMMHVKNLGKKSLKEVKDKMYQLGLYFKSYEN